MTQEDKQLLLVDLCARLPYGVILDVDTTDWKEPQGHIKVKIEGLGILCKDMSLIVNGSYYGKKYKPYLRPLSSMTEEEKNELCNLCTMGNGSLNSDWEEFGISIIDTHPRFGDSFSTDYSALNWLNKNMFDYRGLIPNGLAISTEVFNPYKD